MVSSNADLGPSNFERKRLLRGLTLGRPESRSALAVCERGAVQETAATRTVQVLAETGSTRAHLLGRRELE